ncbi:hypothetical protein SEUCBS139899_009912 [Sporothrix eucalyptigena]
MTTSRKEREEAETRAEEPVEAMAAAPRVTESPVAQAGGAGHPSDEPGSLTAPPRSHDGDSHDEEDDNDGGAHCAASPAGWADDDDMFAPAPAAPAPLAVLVAPQATSVAGALSVPCDLVPLPYYRCFRAAFFGSGPLAAPDCIFVGGSIRCAHTSCRHKGNCRPLPALMAGDCQAILAIVHAVLRRAGLAADAVLAPALRAFARKVVQAVDGHKKGFGLSGDSPTKVNIIESKPDEEGARDIVDLVIGKRGQVCPYGDLDSFDRGNGD